MLKKYQKKLRKKLTPHEQFMWSLLRNRNLSGFKFRRQEIIGKFIVDFVCYEKKLIIELDGGQHFADKLYDNLRTQYLKDQGFHIMRFWNVNVPGNAEKILSKIYAELVKI
jgi:very-short-patch-repair endonuclease